MGKSGGETRTDGIHQALRADILAGRLVPGARLKFPDLAARYQVSVGATREALTRLVAEGLVVTRPHLGFQVRPLSHQDLAELTQARVEIESLVLRRSVQEGDVHWEAGAVAAHHLLERTPYRDPRDPGHLSEQWSRAHAAFHHALLTGCGNRRLLETAQSLRQEAELYLQWSVSLGNEPTRDVPAEHRAILDAVLARDAGRAQELLRDHIAHTAQLLISCAPDQPNRVG
ncbi:GntR family transcriptional regulator [Amycolatopsis sp. PS_44_ISF1]|uniref:GntR family transcriptional regulator n=1 Tax=Amycolatopsis sp. PS_44_ISF1 TaxID=2974917 RepID=UPI0028DE4ED1|nr:GntR family transcriptional regulator [Amycolatopsis sp. PS_44_ISF1]MDT8913093.1 GntR family transcriptional regulator [Amycolatopsis sp. PS_44_ISF1]